jgi:hypothetical protein
MTQETYQHFREGISKLKQVTGHCHRDVQGSIIAVCADAAPPGVIVAVRALLHFHYLVQSPCINNDDVCRISAALDEFHTNKDAIINAGVRRGKGHTVINNWYIPKLELMQNIVPSIRSSGVMGQWSVDVTSSKGQWDQCQSHYAPLLSDRRLFTLLTILLSGVLLLMKLWSSLAYQICAQLWLISFTVR